MPDWNHVHAELRRRGVPLALLWEGYRAGEPDGNGYSRFCDLYREWRRGINATMRQTHAAGEKLFVDFAGDTVPVFDALTGVVKVSVMSVPTNAGQRTAASRLALAFAFAINALINAFA